MHHVLCTLISTQDTHTHAYGHVCTLARTQAHTACITSHGTQAT